MKESTIDSSPLIKRGFKFYRNSNKVHISNNGMPVCGKPTISKHRSQVIYHGGRIPAKKFCRACLSELDLPKIASEPRQLDMFKEQETTHNE